MEKKNNTIQTIYNWEIVRDEWFEYVEGNRGSSDKIFETSKILYKIPMKEWFLIITENESVYRLPYYSNYC